MSPEITLLIGGATLSILGAWFMLTTSERSAEDVCRDLDPEGEDRRASFRAATSRENGLEDEEYARGLLLSPEHATCRRPAAQSLAVFIVVTAVFQVCGYGSGPARLLVSIVVSAAAAYLYYRYRREAERKAAIRELEFYLPLVMERMVMAVQAGHDILSAMNTLLSLSEEAGKRRETPDPVTRLLDIVHRLTIAGNGFEESLLAVAGLVECPALRHAFIHLAQAHREGGELIVPLRELSDSTQLYYQESVEEEIAKLPVRATLPLLCTFLGLVICFVTTPIVQVLSMSKRAQPLESSIHDVQP